VLGGNSESRALAKTGEPEVFAVLEPRDCCAVRPSNTPPSTTAVSKQTGTSQARQGLASWIAAYPAGQLLRRRFRLAETIQ